MRIHYLLFVGLLVSCSSPKNPEYTAFINATLIDGSGSAPVENAVLVIKDHHIVSVGTGDASEYSNVIDLKGKFIIPGLINSHAHVGGEKALQNLELCARYGVTTVVSLGGETKENELLRDIHDSTNTTHARLYMAGEVITGETYADAAEMIDLNAVIGVDWMKIRVDDNLGTSTKMSEETYTGVIGRSHNLGFKIATHMYYLDDAKKLLVAGSDLMAHSVRDLPVDQAFIDLIKEKKACYCPTLTRELSTFVYGSTPGFFSDPFFTKEYDSAVTAPLKDPARQEQVRGSKSAQTYQRQLPVAMANLKTLSDAGVPIAFGTDSGIPTRFLGYFEHIELAMMAEAGMSPMKIIVSATKDAAKCMGLREVGQLAKGYKADFIVLNADPLADIKNTRKIESVWLGGKKVNMSSREDL